MGAVGTSIIYSIGAVGSSATVAKFAAVGAAVFVVGKAIDELTESSEKYQRLLNNLRTDMGQFNTETKGLIDTQASLEQVIKVQTAGVTLSAKELAAFGKAAVRVNQAMGGGPEGATKIFQDLTNGLSKGTGRAFKQLGIDIENTEDLLLAQNEIVQKVTDKYSGLTAEVETTREAVFVLGNNFGTINDQMIAAAGNSDALKSVFDAMNETLAFQSELLEETNGHILDMNSLFGVMAIQLAALIDEFAILGDVAAKFGVNSTVLRAAGLSQVGQAKQAGAADKAEAAAKSASLFTPTAAPTGGRGRGGKAKADVLEFSLEDVEFFEQTGASMEEFFRSNPLTVGARLAPSLSDFESLTGGQTLTEKQIQDQLEQVRISSLTREELWMHELEQEERMRQLAFERQAFRDEMAGVEHARRITEMEAFLGIEQAGVDQSFEIWNSGLQGRLELFRGFFAQLSVLQESQSRAAFSIGKAAAISEAVISGILGAQKAFTAMAGIPLIGPALGAIAATAALIGAAIQVRKIAATKFGKASNISGGGASFGGGSAPSGPIGGGSQGGGGTTVIQLNLDGQQIQEAVVSANDSAQQQGRQAFATAS